jgi:hypothetical protein
LENTYTYIARSAQDSEKVVTFTLHDGHMSVEVGAPLEQVERALQTEEGEIDVDTRTLVQPWVKPLTLSLLERGFDPIRLSDVYASAEDEGLNVIAWLRTGGLRVAPVTFDVERVDNPEATRAFVDELNRRKATATFSGKLPGFLDYWASWFLVITTLFVAVLIWLRTRDGEEEA